MQNYFEIHAEMYKLWPRQAQYMYIDHFDLYLTPVTLTFNLTKKMFQLALLLLRGQQLRQTVLKSMHYCTSYGPDKPGWTHACTDAHMDAHTYTELKL